MSVLSTFCVLVVVISVLIGVLNYSPDEATLYRKMIEFSFSKTFEYGCFCIYNKLDETQLKLGNSCSSVCSAQIIINDNRFYKKLVLEGAVGLGESYTSNYFTYDDTKYDLGDILTELTIGVTNGEKSVFDYILNYFCVAKWHQWYERKYLIAKTEKEDKESVEHHYDLGDEVFKAFLDDTMYYTCAMWKNNNMSLYDAQTNKIDILTKKMDIGPDDKVLDFGTGWGFTPYYINKKTGAMTMGLTMSKNQHEHNVNKFADRIGDKLNYKYLDYRNFEKLIQYKFNKIISIGMVEHVHIKNIDQLFNVSTLILDPERDNLIGLHYFTQGDITPNKIFVAKEKACETQTWIFKYIFPGCCLLLPDWVTTAAHKFGFTLIHQEHYGFHYAKTLKMWRNKWYEPETKAMVNEKYGDIGLFKLYEYYFAISEAMFRTGHVTLIHQIFIKANEKKNTRYADFDYILNNFKIPHQ